MAYLFITPRPQFVSAINQLLVSGKLTFYEAGSPNKKNTYSDAALTTPNTNPIILDARGEPDNAIYLDGTYKVVAQDSDDVIIWTEDNYTGVPPAASSNTDLAAYGEMYFYENADGTAVPLTSNYYQVAADDPTSKYTAGPLEGFTFANDALTCTTAGTYLVNVSLTPKSAGGVILDFAVFVDGVRQDNLVNRAFDSNGTNPRPLVSLSGLLALAANEVVDIRVRNETSTAEPVIEYMNVSLIRVAA